MPNNPRMINNITERNEQQYLLLSTTYPLNSSHMNKLYMGLQSTKEGTLEPIVKLTGNYAEGINFECMETISREYETHEHIPKRK